MKTLEDYEEIIKNKCKDCTKECNKGIVRQIDGNYHCADEE